MTEPRSPILEYGRPPAKPEPVRLVRRIVGIICLAVALWFALQTHFVAKGQHRSMFSFFGANCIEAVFAVVGIALCVLAARPWRGSAG